jgi:hypothetical protein
MRPRRNDIAFQNMHLVIEMECGDANKIKNIDVQVVRKH